MFYWMNIYFIEVFLCHTIALICIVLYCFVCGMVLKADLKQVANTFIIENMSFEKQICLENSTPHILFFFLTKNVHLNRVLYTQMFGIRKKNICELVLSETWIQTGRLWYVCIDWCTRFYFLVAFFTLSIKMIINSFVFFFFQFNEILIHV